MIVFQTVCTISILFLILYLFIVFKFYYSFNYLNYLTSKIQLVVSIIVSLHNEAKNVQPLIECLVSQNYPKEKFEIILVNDRSTDDTQNLIEEATTKNANIRMINIKNLQSDFSPKKYAIDSAINKANGDIIMLTDADGRPGKNWIQSIVSVFSEETGLVIGNAPYFQNTLLQKILAMEYFSHVTIAAATTGLEFPLTCVGTNMAYRKRVYKEIDGFGEFKKVHSGDDDLFLQRVRDNTSWKTRYAVSKNSHVYNAPPNTIKQFLHQRLRYASKGFKYPIGVTVSLFAYYLFNVFIFLMGLLTLTNMSYLIWFTGILIIKGLADFLLMKKSAKTLNTKIYFRIFPLLNLLHIPYVIFFGLMGNIWKYEWAGINH